MSKRREGLRTVAFMFGVTAACMAAVSAVQLGTARVVARNEALFLQRAVLEAAGIPAPASAAATAARYAACVRAVPRADRPAYYLVTDAQRGLRRYVFVSEGAGLWGTITAVVGLDAGLQALSGARFVRHNETPGLGARIDEAWFLRQLAGRRPPLSLAPEGTRSPEPGRIDAITGATITSAAVRDILNRTAASAPDTVNVKRGDA